MGLTPRQRAYLFASGKLKSFENKENAENRKAKVSNLLKEAAGLKSGERNDHGQINYKRVSMHYKNLTGKDLPKRYQQ